MVPIDSQTPEVGRGATDKILPLYMVITVNRLSLENISLTMIDHEEKLRIETLARDTHLC